MVCTLFDGISDATKCSKLKWNHESQANVLIAKFSTFMASFLWSYKSAAHEKISSIRFFTKARRNYKQNWLDIPLQNCQFHGLYPY